MTQRLVLLGSVLAFLGVAIGAFGAHALQGRLEANGMRGVYETGVQYHMIHALALLLVATLSENKLPARWLQPIGFLFAVGIVLFSGSLYVLAVTDIKILGAITPLGGICFLAGWALLAVAAVRTPSLK